MPTDFYATTFAADSHANTPLPLCPFDGGIHDV